MAERASRTDRRTGPVEPAPENTDTAGPGTSTDPGGTGTSTGPDGTGRVDAEATGTRTGPALDGAPGASGSASAGGGAPTPEPSSRGSAGQGAPGRPTADGGATGGSWSPHPRGLEPHEVRSRWNEVQGGFIDDPRQAVHEADALASEVAEAVVAEIASRHSALRSVWSDSGSGDTETLRISLRDYRAFVQRLVGENAG